jgi:glutathione S-transferase
MSEDQKIAQSDQWQLEFQSLAHMCIGSLESQLKQSEGSFIVGGDITVADICMFDAL